jgi:hypothetical protein
MNMDVITRQVLNKYLKLISLRASGSLNVSLKSTKSNNVNIEFHTDFFKKKTGKLLTAASWIRQFVLQHPDYKHDSVVRDTIAYDLLKAISQVVSPSSFFTRCLILFTILVFLTDRKRRTKGTKFNWRF